MRAFLLATSLVVPTTSFADTRPSSPIAAATQAARIAPRASGWQGATQLFTYTSGGLYVVTAAVGQVTDIVLQEGETLSDTGAVAAGDTVRWVIGEAASGEGVSRRTHILVKPTDPGLATNLVINTNKRTYHVELRSSARVYMASVGWSYPQDELIAIQRAKEAADAQASIQAQAGIDLATLNFGYRLSGANVPWRPTQVFDDGAKTYVVMPADIAQNELPPLFLLGEKHQAELVNYRVSGRYIIVDRLLSIAELRLGTTEQKVVRITRTGERAS